MNLQRRLIMRQRRAVRPPRRLVATDINEERNAIRYRCQDCNRQHWHEFPRKGPKALTGFGLRQMLRWHGPDSAGDGRGGCTGLCPHCTQAARDRLYPLP